MTLQSTALYNSHKSLNGKMIEFADWTMPAFYKSPKDEHKHVRTHCGIFDVSHMGQFVFKGQGARLFLNNLLSNDIANLKIGHGQYTLLLNDQGGVRDDWIIYQISEDTYLACVNAAKLADDWNWIQKNYESLTEKDFKIENLSGEYSQIAVQGPQTFSVLSNTLKDRFPGWVDQSKTLAYMGIASFPTESGTVWIARTGYTGEFGYEFYLPNTLTESVWNALLTDPRVKPIGLAARDTLRLESCYHLYGQDMNEKTLPEEVGLKWAVKRKKGAFIGNTSPLPESFSKKLLGFQLCEPGVARTGMEVFSGETLVGSVTSGSALPTVEFSGGLCFLDTSLFSIDDSLTVDIRGKRKSLKIIDKPFYKAQTHTNPVD